MGKENRSAITGMAGRALLGITSEIAPLGETIAGIYTHGATFSSPRGRILGRHYYRSEQEARAAIQTWEHILGAAIEQLTQADDISADQK
jgi:hypothetical protein